MNIFFAGWMSLVRVLVIGVLAYAGLVLLLRVSGKRTLGKMNAFDWVVTVAMGSTLATALLSPQVTLADGLAALGLLVALQYAVAWTATRLPRFQKLVKSEPRMIFLRGQFLREAMRAERVSEADVLQAVRDAGLGSLSKVHAVILETNGDLSVVQPGPEPMQAIEGVQEDG